MGDTPVGLIENVSFDEDAGSISFRARLSMGAIPASNSPSSPWVPSKDVYAFTGTLGKDALSGTLSHALSNYPGQPAPTTSETLNLPLTNDVPGGMTDFRTFGEWQSHARMLLRFRGPKE